MSQLKNGPITQIGYVVENLDTAIAGWIETAGLGPWTVFRNVSMEGTFEGEATVVTMDVGMAYQGDVQIELIEPTNAARSPYRADDGALLCGPHHIAWLVDDLDAATAQAAGSGLREVFRAWNPGTRVAYFELPGQPHTRFEYIEGAAMPGLIAAGIAASQDWDGTNPVHVIDFAAMDQA